MYRDIYKDLKRWKDDPYRKPLLLTGVRQCGKTYAVSWFAREDFPGFVYVNFEQSPNLSAIFDYDLDVKRILSELERFLAVRIVPGETLVFFDEIQACPRAITSLKYFCEDMPSLHVIGAGSLLEVVLNRDGVSFPVGKVDRLSMFPMNFREFCIACGRDKFVGALEGWPADRPVPGLYDDPMKKLLRDFYIVGGMPEAVSVWLETGSYDRVEKVQRDILDGYSDDFSKHAPVSEVPRIRWIWDSVPVQLAKENNKFVFSHVREGKRSAQLEDALQWLTYAGLIVPSYLVEKPQLPLSGFADRTYFKVYMSDIGLLRARCGLSARSVLEESGAYSVFRGALAENYVFNELRAAGKEAYFWRSGNSAEVDFLFSGEAGIVPVEVKAADNTQAKSYRLFCRKYSPRIGFKLSGKNMSCNDIEGTRTFSIPLYMAWALDRYMPDASGAEDRER